MDPIIDLSTYLSTRQAWHTLAERVLAPARHAATGRIGLVPAPGGFATPPFATPPFTGPPLTGPPVAGPPFTGERVLAVDAGGLVVRDGDRAVRHRLTTLGDAAAAVGQRADADTGVYTPTTPGDPDHRLAIDPTAAGILAAWFAFGKDLLELWIVEQADAEPSTIQLWPEHFDLACDLGGGGRRANYGASPGDEGHPQPYLYVGPWEPDGDAFWNAGTYARVPYGEIVTAADPVAAALDFFREGAAVVAGPKS